MIIYIFKIKKYKYFKIDKIFEKNLKPYIYLELFLLYICS